MVKRGAGGRFERLFFRINPESRRKPPARPGGYEGTGGIMIKDLTGMRFGKLTAIRYIKTGNSVKWVCRCDCGNEVISYGYDLHRGRTVSCGCKKKRHNGRYSRLYSIWQSMKKRCSNENHKFYKYYGGKGISVCSEWKKDFTAFRDWALQNGYADNLSIDRINSEKDYSPDNCQWITISENTRKADKERWERERRKPHSEKTISAP